MGSGSTSTPWQDAPPTFLKRVLEDALPALSKAGLPGPTFYAADPLNGVLLLK